MLSYKMIKRKYKLNDSNIADFFGYKNRLSFFNSSLKDLLISYIERTYEHYEAGGVKGAADYIKGLTFPGAETRKKQYKAGLYEFVDTVNFQQRKNKYIDPVKGPRVKMYKYKLKKS